MSLEPWVEAARDRAAERAVSVVESGMLVGLGTGDTASRAIKALGARVREGLAISAVATSIASETLARSLGIRVLEPDAVGRLDLTLDGADEVDDALRLIKGLGGALTREKLVAHASAKLIIVVDSAKRVARVGERVRLPVEILPFGHAWTLAHLGALSLEPRLRLRAGAPCVTDNGGWIADCRLGAEQAPESVAAALDGLAGVIEHGLFLDEAASIYVGHRDRVEQLLR